MNLLPGAPELLLFTAAVFVLNATPGADFLLTVTRTATRGWRAGLAAASGIATGCLVHAGAAAFGLAALLALHPAAFTAVKWAGAAYLVWLGVGLLRQALRGQGEAVTHSTGGSPRTDVGWADFRAGLLTNLLNPKVALFILAFVPQWVPADSPHPTASFVLLGVWLTVQGLLFLFALVALAGALARWQTPGPARRALGALAGLLFIALALRLVGSSRPATA